MGEVSACSVSWRAFAAGRCDMRCSVTLSKQGRLKGQFHVCLHAVHVVEVV